MDEISCHPAQLEDTRSFNAAVASQGGLPLFKAIFGQFNFSSLIEFSFSALFFGKRVEGVEDDVCVSFIAVHENVSSTAEPDAAEKVVDELSHIFPAQISNTVFLNFFLVHESHISTGHAMIRKIFAMHKEIDYIVWLAPVSARLTDPMKEFFVLLDTSQRKSISEEDPLRDHKVYVIKRKDYLPKLLVREARVEDNDELLPILRNNNPQLLDGQEDFFLADLISSQDSRNNFFVGVSHSHVVGMLATSLDVNVSLITKIYDLEPFPDIIIQKEERSLPPPEVVALVGDVRLLKRIPDLSRLINGLNCVYIDAEVALSSIPFANQGEESAIAAIDCLNAVIAAELALPERQGSHVPGACVVVGFPRSDEEAVAISQGRVSFSYILEIQNMVEDTEGEEDDFLQCHLDSVETLRQVLQDMKDTPANVLDMSQWIKFPMEEGNDGSLLTELGIVLDERQREIDTQRALDADEPPQANAFAITVFCVEEDFQSRSDDILRIAFEDHSNHDYCVFMIPNNAPPSILTNSMIIAQVRPGVSFDQTLYVLHRDVLLAQDFLHVARMTEKHLPALESFLGSLGSDQQVVLQAASNSIRDIDVELKDNPAEVSFAVLMGKDIIGSVGLSRKIVTNDDVTWLRANFHVDDYINYDKHRGRAQACITHWLVNPTFARCSRFLLREVMRRYGKTLLYFQALKELSPPKEIMEEFVPVAPRRRLQPFRGDSASLSLFNRPTPAEATVESPLFCLSKAMLSQPRTIITTRVVVVGGNASAYAILETLCFIPKVYLQNIFFVVEQPPKALDIYGNSPSMATEHCGSLSEQDADFPGEGELYALGLAHRVVVIRGRLTDIDRDNRAIVISDELVLEYDVLVVAAATQDASSKRFPSTKAMHPSTCAEKGIFCLGSQTTDSSALRWVQEKGTTRNSAVVICGTGLNALVAAGNLMHNGVHADRISLVINEDAIEEIGHELINDSIELMLRKSGMTIYKGFAIVDVNFSHTGKVASVVLKDKNFNEKFVEEQKLAGKPRSRTEEKEDGDDGTRLIPCLSLLCCGPKQCGPDVFTAVNESGLVYDGGLVVDENFRTADSYIYAVGDFTRFSRIYRDLTPHSRYNAREMGCLLASKIVRKYLDPFSADVDFYRPAVGSKSSSNREPTSASSSLVGVSTRRHMPVAVEALPTFLLPRTFCSRLPGGLFLVRSRLPVVGECTALVTGDMGSDSISVLKTDLLGTAQEFVYVGTSTVEEKNLGRLLGWHESFLNCAVSAYDQGRVDDWIEFFRDDWVAVLLHDQFSDLVRTLRISLQADKGTFMLIDGIMDSAVSTSDDAIVVEGRRQRIGDGGSSLPELTQKTVHAHTIEFLRRNQSMLTRFSIPPIQSQTK